MSSNEYIDEETANQKQAQSKKKAAPKKSRKKKSSDRNSGRMVVQIMNGEFLSKDWFVRNLPFTFYIGFLLVVLIGWGYYGETMTKKEVQLQEELSELNSEYFTLKSEYITKKGRGNIKERLAGTGLVENLTTPNKIRVRKYRFD